MERRYHELGRRGNKVGYFLLLRAFVTACRIVVPAFSISLLVRPIVTHTFSAGGKCCFGGKLSSSALRRVMRTPLARH